MFLKNKRAFIFILVFGVMALYAAPKYQIKLATDAPDGSSWVTSIKDISNKLKEKTQGNVEISVFAGGVMGDQSTILKKIKIGQLSASSFSSGGLSLVFKDFAVMGFPMIFTNYEEYDYLKEKMQSYFENEFEKKGFVLLSFTEVGLIYLYSNKQVNSVETLRQSKPLLIAGDDISKALFDEVKVSPKPLQTSDIMTGLQTGLIDTIFSSTYLLFQTQWFTKVKYMADLPVTFMIGGFLIDKKFFDSMPESYRNEIKSSFKNTFNMLNAKVRKDNDDAMKSLKKVGITILPVPEKDKKVFSDVCSGTALKLTEKEYSRELYNTIEKHVNDFRKSKR